MEWNLVPRVPKKEWFGRRSFVVLGIRKHDMESCDIMWSVGPDLGQMMGVPKMDWMDDMAAIWTWPWVHGGTLQGLDRSVCGTGCWCDLQIYRRTWDKNHGFLYWRAPVFFSTAIASVEIGVGFYSISGHILRSVNQHMLVDSHSVSENWHLQLHKPQTGWSPEMSPGSWSCLDGHWCRNRAGILVSLSGTTGVTGVTGDHLSGDWCSK